MKYKIATVFFIALLASFFYATFWSRMFAGNWRALSFIADMPLALIASAVASMIFFMREKLPHGSGRAHSISGFAGLLILILFVLAVEKYSFVFPKETWIFALHPLEPVIFTISASFILRGMDELLQELKN